MRNTVSQFKRFIGRKFNDPEVQHELKRGIPYQVIEQPGGKIGIKVGEHVKVETCMTLSIHAFAVSL